jgi:hypothetical protein
LSGSADGELYNKILPARFCFDNAPISRPKRPQRAVSAPRFAAKKPKAASKG